MSLLDWFNDFYYVIIKKLRKVKVDDLLSDTAGHAIKGKTIQVSYQPTGASSWTSDGAGTTNNAGKVSNTIYLLHGNYNFRANFSGGQGYDPSTALKYNVAV